jgi:iron complex outermembrane recepter protein
MTKGAIDMITFKQKLLTSAIPALMLLGSAPVFAQDTPAENSGLEEIVVTAQRREENLQDVPISVSAFTAEQLKAQGTTDISRLENVVPGFQFGRSGPDARPAIRGVRTENVGVNGDTTIGFFVDGVYQSRSQQATLSFVDIERVEVQRGPQGTLYGRNTFGGNIAISTAKPSLDRIKGGVDLTAGQNGRYRGEAYLNVPFGEIVALRVAGSWEESSGYVKNVNPLGNNLFDDKTRYARASILFKPSDAFSALLKFDYSKQGGAGGAAFGYKLRGTYYNNSNGSPSQQLYNDSVVVLNSRGANRDGVIDAPLTNDAGVPIFAADDPYTIDTDQPTVLNLRNYGFSATLAYDFGGVTLRSITGYTDFLVKRSADSDFSGNTVAVDQVTTTAKTLSQEVQFLSDASEALTYVVGGYFFKDKLRNTLINQQSPLVIRNVTPNITGTAFRGGFFDDQRAETQSIAAYAQASYAFTDKLKFTAGVRFTRDKKDFAFANERSVVPLTGTTPPGTDGTFIRLDMPTVPDSAFGVKGAPTNCTYVAAGTTPAPRAGFQCLAANPLLLTGATYDTATFQKVTWRAGLDYQMTDDNLLYASVSTGFRSGGFNSGQNQAALTPTFAPEKVLAFEVGSKNRFADNRVQINLAAFYNRYNGLQEQRQVPIGPATLSVIENSGKARSYGAEIEAIFKPVDALTLGFSGSYLNAKYTEYLNVPTPNNNLPITILVNDATALTPTLVNGVQIAGIGQRRLFAPGYNCGLVPGTGGAGQPPANFGCDLSGKSLPHSPEISGSIYASYDIDLGSAGKLTPYAVLTFSGSFFGQPFNSILEKQAAYSKIDLRLTWALNETYEVQGFVNNVTDKATANRFVWGGGGALQASYAPPRLWGVRGSFKF